MPHLKPMALTQEEISSFQEAKSQRDFVYKTNQTLQSLSQGLIGLSLSYEKNLQAVSSNLKRLEIEFENYKKVINDTADEHFSDMGDKITETIQLADEIHHNVDDIYENYASLEDMAGVQLTLEKRCDDLEMAQKVHAAYVDSAALLSKGQLQAQIDDLRRLIDQPDLGHQQCEISLQIKRNEDSVTINGLQVEIERLKRQCDYNQKQFEYAVIQIDRLKGVSE